MKIFLLEFLFPSFCNVANRVLMIGAAGVTSGGTTTGDDTGWALAGAEFTGAGATTVEWRYCGCVVRDNTEACSFSNAVSRVRAISVWRRASFLSTPSFSAASIRSFEFPSMVSVLGRLLEFAVSNWRWASSWRLSSDDFVLASTRDAFSWSNSVTVASKAKSWRELYSIW